MSVTTAIENISNHLKNAYNELQGLGADLTNVNKNIENISMILDNIYDSMPQVSGEGTSLTLDNTKVGKIKSTLKGNTSQSGTPTPDYPQEIQVVTGDNTIDICGKNIINIPNRTYTNSTISVVANDGVLTINGTNSTTGNIIVEFTGINNYTTNQNITMVRNGDDISDGNAQLFLTVDGTEYNMGNQTSHPDWRTLSYSGTITRLRLRIAPGASYTNFKIKPMLYLGDYDSSILFKPYKGASYPINLGNIELCKIGNYQDYIYKGGSKWYLHKEIEKVVLNGTEDWGISSGNFYMANLTNYKRSENKPYSNYYQGTLNTDSASGITNGQIAFNKASEFNRFYLSNTSISSIKDIKDWLSTHNTEVYYVLATPTDTEITDTTLINQLNALEQAMSYDDQTNISQENDNLPFIINATALIKNSD